jgi:hypothetical protein
VTAYEETLEDLYIVFVRAQVQKIAAGLLEDAFTLLGVVKEILLVVGPHEVVVCIYPIASPGFGVFGFDHADGRQLHIHLIIDLYPDEIVFLACYFQGVLESGFRFCRGEPLLAVAVDEITQEEGDGSLPGAAIEEADGLA